MKYYARDYINDTSLSNDKSLYACSIVLAGGEEIFAYAREIDVGVFYLQDPLKLIRWTDEGGNPLMIFKKFNYFSDDTTMILDRSHVVSINYLSESFLESYKTAIVSIAKKTEDLKASKTVLNEEYGDFYADVEIPKILN